MANFLDNRAGSSQTVCDWLAKYNTLCEELETEIPLILAQTDANIQSAISGLGLAVSQQILAIQTVNTSQGTAITELQNEYVAQQTQIDNLIANGGGNFVPLAGANVEEGFYLAVEDARMQLSGNGVELIIPAVGYVALSPDGFTTDKTTKAGYLNDTTLRTYASLGDKEWVAKGQLQKATTFVDFNGGFLPYSKHLFANVENFDGATVAQFFIPNTSSYQDGDRITLCIPERVGIDFQIISQAGIRITTDIVGVTSVQNVNGDFEFTDASQPAGTYCSKYELVYSGMFGFLVDVKHYV